MSPEDLEPHRRLLWGVCYRITGVAADADDLVQETFARALTSPPADRSRELLPWLVRVATNASRDALRRRTRESYYGTWLPSPIDSEVERDEPLTPAARYTQLESVSYAFLLALEALSPTQRAIVILRDVLDYSVHESAEVLGLSEANVKTSHHRARARLEAYERDRPQLDPKSKGIARGAMTQFFARIALDDVEGLERLLAGDAVGFNDGGGEFFAAARPIQGPHRVARFYHRLSFKNRVVGARVCELNGLPAVIIDVRGYVPGVAPKAANLFAANAAGHITSVYSVFATRKITHLA